MNITSITLTQSHSTSALDSYFVTAILTILVVLSLILTFYNKGTAVHKVIGLLMVSIFVVFLWIFKTQFLFIYLVYILAFISAVLMLFLSVVLMLPISTLNKNYVSIKNMPAMILFSSEFVNVLTLETVMLFVIMYIYWALFINKNTETKNSFYNYAYGAKRTLVTAKNYSIEGLSKLSAINKEFFKFTNVYPQLNLYSGYTSFKLFFIKLINVAVNLAYKLVYVTVLLIKSFFEKLYNERNVKNTIVDTVIQLYLFVNLLLLTFSIKVNNKASSVLPDFSTIDSGTSGLGLLKEMLYNQYGSFLIISTLVLLVALIGAAVMTKNTK